MPLPVSGNLGTIHEEPRDASDQDTEGNREAQMWDTNNAPAAGVLRDGATHKHNHNAVLERQYPDRERLPPDRAIRWWTSDMVKPLRRRRRRTDVFVIAYRVLLS